MLFSYILYLYQKYERLLQSKDMGDQRTKLLDFFIDRDLKF